MFNKGRKEESKTKQYEFLCTFAIIQFDRLTRIDRRCNQFEGEKVTRCIPLIEKGLICVLWLILNRSGKIENKFSRLCYVMEGGMLNF